MAFTRKETPLKYPGAVGSEKQEMKSIVLADRMGTLKTDGTQP